MQRRQFLHGLALGTVAGAAFPAANGAESPATAESGGRLATTPPVLQAPRPDGLDVVWGLSGHCLGRVEWEGTDGSRGVAGSDAHGFVPQGTRFLRVRVDGLRPGTEYRLRSVTVSASEPSREETGDWRPFRTPDPRADRTRFVVWNDTHVNNETIGRLDEVTPAADFLVWNGDTCNDWHREDDLVPTLLHPGGRDISRGRPLHVVWGNHDVRGAWAFRMPDMIPTPSGRPFHAIRSGPVAAVFLHTGEDKPDDHPSFRGRVAFDRLRREQAEWLESAIRRPEMASAPHRIVFCHIPLRWLDEGTQDYSAGGFDRHSGRSRAAWHDALVRWGAQVIISGHTHHAAWLPPSDPFPYGQLVGGGPRPDGATWIDGTAGPDGMRLVTRRLDGSVVHDLAFPRV